MLSKKGQLHVKPEDKDKLNQCLDILDTTDLGLSLVWLWTWNSIKNHMSDETVKFNLNEDEVWIMLTKAVEEGKGFSLEYGAEQHYEDVQNWLFENNIMTDTMFEDED